MIRKQTFLIGLMSLTMYWLTKDGAHAKINPEYIELLDICNQQNMTALECKDMLSEHGVKLLIVKPRSIDDIFYNQVVIPVDYLGNVLGGSPNNAFDGMVHYPFLWRTKPLWGEGNRTIGPWDCKDLKGAECCTKIESDVIDRDIHNKLIDCWLTEAKIKGDDGVMMQVYKDADGIIRTITRYKLAAFNRHENKVRIQLIEEILSVLERPYISKDVAFKFVGRIRQSLRDIERAQLLAYNIGNQIRQVWDNEYIPMNGVMTSTFQLAVKILTELWVSGGRESLRARDGNLLVIRADDADWNIEDTVKFQNWLDIIKSNEPEQQLIINV